MNDLPDVVASRNTTATIVYDTAKDHPLDLEQILALQRANLPTSIGQHEQQREGFVTVQHDIDLLREMNADPFPHIIAKHNDKVVGYALILQPSFEARLPLLSSMVRRLRAVTINDQPLTESTFFIMGQVCIQKEYRSRYGVFTGLYRTLQERMAVHFRYVVTLIAARNPRSLRAHYKVGFRNVLRYQDDDETGEEWVVVLWDWHDPV
jgi:hypothetical protein